MVLQQKSGLDAINDISTVATLGLLHEATDPAEISRLTCTGPSRRVIYVL